MLTLFSIPKPFRGHTGTIQRNAITSWALLSPGCEIILFGDEEGIQELAQRLHVCHVPSVARNSFGTPLVSDVFTRAQAMATYDLCVYCNADIILMDNFTKAVERVAVCMRHFLMVGRRWDLELKGPIDFAAPAWQALLMGVVFKQGSLHPESGMDYFVFRRGTFTDIPPFAVGRIAWDNWLVYHSRILRIPVVDATSFVTAVHQNHTYPSPHILEGPEAQQNLALAGGYAHAFTIQDATHTLDHRGIRRNLTGGHLRRVYQTMPLLYPKTHVFINGIEFARRCAIFIKRRLGSLLSRRSP